MPKHKPLPPAALAAVPPAPSPATIARQAAPTMLVLIRLRHECATRGCTTEGRYVCRAGVYCAVHIGKRLRPGEQARVTQ